MSNKREAAGAAWKKTIQTKAGETIEVFSITIGDKRYDAFWNSYKVEGDKQPDLKIYESNYTPKEAAAPAKKSFAGQDDLPF